MFGELVTAYLFLAGVGAGGVAVASVADLLLVREPFGADVVPDFAEKRPAERLVVGVLALSCGALALGAGCLAADLGRIDRVLSLFLTPPATLMNLGAWAVALLTVLAAALALARFLYLPWANRRAVVVAEVVACGLAVVVAVYAVEFHGDAVDHYGHVGRLETAHVDLRVAEAAAVLGHVDARGRFQDFGELLPAEFVADLLGVDRRYGYRGFALHGHRLHDDDILQCHGVGLHLDDAQACVRARDGFFGRDVAHVADLDLLGIGLQREVAVDVGADTLRCAGYGHRGTDQRCAGLIYDFTRNCRLRDSGGHSEQDQGGRHEEML